MNVTNLEKAEEDLRNSVSNNKILTLLKIWNRKLYDYAKMYLHLKTMSDKVHTMANGALRKDNFINFGTLKLSMYIQHHKRFSTIATWNDSQNMITLLNWTDAFKHSSVQSILPSQCAKSCEPGHHAIQYNQKGCCKMCIRCPAGSYKNNSGLGTCLKCPKQSVSSLNRTHCQPLVESYLNFGAAKVLYILLGVGILATLFITFVYFKHRKSPVVRSSDTKMTAMQLACHFGLFLSILLFVGRPARFQCGAQIVITKLLLTLVITSIFVRTERLLKVFQSKTIVSGRQRLWKRAVDVFILLTLTVIQQAIIFLIFLYNGVGTSINADNEKLVLEIYCNTLTNKITQSIYTSLVTLLCLIQAFNARKLRENYNETKFITLAMLCVLVVQPISMPLLASSNSPQEVSLIEGITIFLCNSFLLLILYGYKIIIILVYPEKNTAAIFQQQTHLWQDKRVKRNMQRRNKNVVSSSVLNVAQVVEK